MEPFRIANAGNQFRRLRAWKLQRNGRTSFALLLGFALCTSGCRTVPPPAPAQTGSSTERASNQEEYNRTFQAESQRRHHHGKHEESSAGWSGLDHAGTADELPGNSNADGARLPRSGHHQNSRALSGSPGQFDFYVLNLSWAPEFCHSHPAAIECAQHRAFTLHGLWPQNNDGTYPENCSEAPGPTSPSQYAGIYPDPSLLEHEWQTHGTCSGLTPDQFFALASRAEQSIHIPAQLSDLTQQTLLTPAEITTLFTQSNPDIPVSSLAISCGNNYLTAVEVCLDKNLKPASCSAIRTCGANQIRIPAPQ